MLRNVLVYWLKSGKRELDEIKENVFYVVKLQVDTTIEQAKQDEIIAHRTLSNVCE